jgi:hypothetical protein
MDTHGRPMPPLSWGWLPVQLRMYVSKQDARPLHIIVSMPNTGHLDRHR